MTFAFKEMDLLLGPAANLIIPWRRRRRGHSQGVQGEPIKIVLPPRDFKAMLNCKCAYLGLPVSLPSFRDWLLDREFCHRAQP